MACSSLSGSVWHACIRWASKSIQGWCIGLADAVLLTCCKRYPDAVPFENVLAFGLKFAASEAWRESSPSVAVAAFAVTAGKTVTAGDRVTAMLLCHVILAMQQPADI